VPLVTGPLPPEVLVEEEARDFVVVLAREVVDFLAVEVVVDFLRVVPVALPGFFVVGISLLTGSFLL
jgi:hypothetical protein